MLRILTIVLPLLVAACGRNGIDLRQADLQALGPAPEGTPLIETKRLDQPPVAFDAQVVKKGKARGVRGTFQRWEVSGKPPADLFSDK